MAECWLCIRFAIQVRTCVPTQLGWCVCWVEYGRLAEQCVWGQCVDVVCFIVR